MITKIMKLKQKYLYHYEFLLWLLYELLCYLNESGHITQILNIIHGTSISWGYFLFQFD